MNIFCVLYVFCELNGSIPRRDNGGVWCWQPIDKIYGLGWGHCMTLFIGDHSAIYIRLFLLSLLIIRFLFPFQSRLDLAWSLTYSWRYLAFFFLQLVRELGSLAPDVKSKKILNISWSIMLPILSSSLMVNILMLSLLRYLAWRQRYLSRYKPNANIRVFFPCKCRTNTVVFFYRSPFPSFISVGISVRYYSVENLFVTKASYYFCYYLNWLKKI